MKSQVIRVRRRAHRREGGVALVTVIIFLALMMVLGLAVTMTGITELEVGSNTRYIAEAFSTAEAGSTHGYELVRNMKGDLTDLIRGADGRLRSGDEFANWGTTPVPLWKNDGTPSGEYAPYMFDTSAVRDIPKSPPIPSGGKERALQRLDDTHWYELVVYDNANSNVAYLGGDAPLELTLDLTGGAADGSENLDCDRRVLIRSIGYVLGDPAPDYASFSFDKVIASAVVDTIVGLTPYPALIVNGDLNIGQSAQITGALGSIHANDDLFVDFSGGGGASGSATWSNNDGVHPGGDWNPTSNAGTGVQGRVGEDSFIDLPDLVPYDYASISDVILFDTDANANQRDAVLKDIADSVAGGSLSAFKTWLVTPAPAGGGLPAAALSGSAAFTLVKDSTKPFGYAVANPTQALYVGGGLDVNITGTNDIPNGSAAEPGKTVLFVVPPNNNEIVHLNGGSGSSTVAGSITLITTGSIRINGNLNIKPAFRLLPPLNPPWAGADITVLAGEDVEFNGTPTVGATQTEGIIYAHEQIDMRGNATVNGQILVLDSSIVYNGSRYVSTQSPRSGSNTPIDDSDVSGNFTLNHSNISYHLGAFGVVSWRELRDFIPAKAYDP